MFRRYHSGGTGCIGQVDGKYLGLGQVSKIKLRFGYRVSSQLFCSTVALFESKEIVLKISRDLIEKITPRMIVFHTTLITTETAIIKGQGCSIFFSDVAKEAYAQHVSAATTGLGQKKAFSGRVRRWGASSASRSTPLTNWSAEKP